MSKMSKIGISGISIIFLISTLSLISALAPLEHSEIGKIYFGPWYDRLHGDTPASINNRLQVNKLSMFQSDVNISSSVQSLYIDNFLGQIEETESDAIAYLTVYPMEGYDAVTDGALKELSDIIAKAAANGRKFFIRYAPEMNGNWFRYGQQPGFFQTAWKRFVSTIRQATSNHSSNVAFVWAPNSGNGYPWLGGKFEIQNFTSAFYILDTNKDNILNFLDDPYSPYYPGDEWVDWVGFSIYHYGTEYPWVTNNVPAPGKFEAILKGQGSYGPFDFYRMFSGDGVGGAPTSLSIGSKPFLVTETASTFHLSNDSIPSPTVPPVNEGRVAIKRAWWRQFLNTSFYEAFPKVKGICTFEFSKHEETTFRDFTSMGDTGTNRNSIFGNDAGPLDGPVLQALREDFLTPEIQNMIIWSSTIKKVVEKPQSPTNDGTLLNVSIFSFLLYLIWIV